MWKEKKKEQQKSKCKEKKSEELKTEGGRKPGGSRRPEEEGNIRFRSIFDDLEGKNEIKGIFLAGLLGFPSDGGFSLATSNFALHGLSSSSSLLPLLHFTIFSFLFFFFFCLQTLRWDESPFNLFHVVSFTHSFGLLIL